MSSSSSSSSFSSSSDDFDPASEVLTFLAKYPLHELVAQQASSSGSSRRRKVRKVVPRDREAAHDLLVSDYFASEPVYSPETFRRRFRMRRDLFLRIIAEVEAYDHYFQQRPDATGRPGLSPLQKCTAAIRQLAYGGPSDSLDEYLKMAETTAAKCLKRFCRAVCFVFGSRYLRKPTANDIQRLYHMHEAQHGFPGMLGSIDCMHWTWRNCPVAWKGQYTRGDHGVPTLMLEAVASYDLWIWHAFFGVAGSNNDINVLNQSDVFTSVLRGDAPESGFEVNGRHYDRGYYLADGIYPEWSVFVKSFPHPLDEKRQMFKARQESARKDVERAFGVLQSRWAIIRSGARFWYEENLKDIMYCCIILHNMIIEDEGSEVENWINDDGDGDPSPASHGPARGFSSYIDMSTEMHSKTKHQELRSDLMDHIWARNGHGGHAP